MNATPGPRLSGRYFLPDAPELCRKVNPEAFVTSTYWIAEVGGTDCNPPGIERNTCARYVPDNVKATIPNIFTLLIRPVPLRSEVQSIPRPVQGERLSLRRVPPPRDVRRFERQ